MKYSFLWISILTCFAPSGADLQEVALIHLYDVHQDLWYNNTCTDEFCHDEIEAESSYFVYEMPKLTKYIKHLKRENRRRGIQTIVLNTGSFTGTKWSTATNKESIDLLNHMFIDYSAFGPHGFDYDNIQETENFVRHLTFPVLCSTLTTTIKRVYKSRIVQMNATKNPIKIGIIGYFRPHGQSDLKFSNVIQTLREESRRLKKRGVKTIVAIGHTGVGHEVVFARDLPDVDVFIGAHMRNRNVNTGEMSQVYPMWVYEGRKRGRRFKYFELYISSKNLHLMQFYVSIDTDTGVIFEVRLIPAEWHGLRADSEGFDKVDTKRVAKNNSLFGFDDDYVYPIEPYFDLKKKSMVYKSGVNGSLNIFRFWFIILIINWS